MADTALTRRPVEYCIDVTCLAVNIAMHARQIETRCEVVEIGAKWPGCETPWRNQPYDERQQKLAHARDDARCRSRHGRFLNSLNDVVV